VKQNEGRKVRRRVRNGMAIVYLTIRCRYVSFLDLHLDVGEINRCCVISC
jgi:hypothetical protein